MLVVTAYLLPWLLGVVWLAWLERWTQSPTNLFKTLGYGFFLGYIACAFVIQAVFYFTNTLSLQLIFGTLVVLLLLGLLLFWRHSYLSSSNSPPAPPTRRKIEVGIVALLLALILIHLGFAAYDAWNNPLLPWDAGTTWTYRAKIWFLNQELSSFSSAANWLKTTDSGIYTINAYRYPATVSLIQLWPVLASGYWNTAVALFPGFLAGIALCMGLYGQLRSLGSSIPAAVLAVYLLISIPLLDAHMALPGYADIWLSGLAGLGFISLLIWSQTQDRGQLLLGLIFLILGITLKREGSVWLATGLAFLLLQIVSWRLILLLISIIAIAILTGHGLVQLPGVGAIGYANKVFYIPGIGNILLQPKDVSMSVIYNLFLYDNWHLLYFALTGMLLLVLFFADKQTAKVIVTFSLLVTAVIVAIFYLSPESAWATNSTALARLLMQTLPAWVFLLFIGWQAAMQGEQQT